MELLGNDLGSLSVARFFNNLNHCFSYFSDQHLSQTDQLHLSHSRVSMLSEECQQIMERNKFVRGIDFFADTLDMTHNRYGEIVGAVTITNYPLFKQRVASITSMSFLETGHVGFGTEDGEMEEDVRAFKSGLLQATEAAQFGDLYRILHSNPSARAHQLRDIAQGRDKQSTTQAVSTLAGLIRLEPQCKSDIDRQHAVAGYIARASLKATNEVTEVRQLQHILQEIDF